MWPIDNPLSPHVAIARQNLAARGLLNQGPTPVAAKCRTTRRITCLSRRHPHESGLPVPRHRWSRRPRASVVLAFQNRNGGRCRQRTETRLVRLVEDEIAGIEEIRVAEWLWSLLHWLF